MAKQYKFKVCTEHPGVGGSMDCAECAAKLRATNKTLTDFFFNAPRTKKPSRPGPARRKTK